MEAAFTPIEKIISNYNDQQSFIACAKQLTASERIVLLKKLKVAILENEPMLIKALEDDFKKCAFETQVTEVFATLFELNHTIKKLNKWTKDKAVGRSLLFFNVKAYLHYEPKGQVLIITPWNYPFQLPMSHLIGAIAAGNTVMLKLSEYAPHCNAIVKKIIQSVFPTKHVAVIEGAVAETTALLELKFDHIHFTGSPTVGKVVMKAASKHLADLTLELGGKSPVFIDKDVNINQVVRNIIWAKFVNAGQTCIAPDYILLDRKLEKEVEASFRKQLKIAFGESPQHAADLARIIHSNQFERLQRGLQEIKNTATIIAGGQTDFTDRYIAPTVLKNVPTDAQLMQEEIFGPILPLVYYDRVEEALAFVASKEKPLALYIFSKNKNYVQQVIKHTNAGGTCVNDALIHIMHPNLPFGGVNNSGIGQSFGWHGFKSFSHERAIADAKLKPSSSLFWFPYTEKSKKTLHFLRKLFL